MSELAAIPAALLAQGHDGSEAAWKTLSNVALLVVIVIVVAGLNFYIRPLDSGSTGAGNGTVQSSQGAEWMKLLKRLVDEADAACDPKMKHFFAMRVLAYALAGCKWDRSPLACFKVHRAINSSNLTDAERVEVRQDALGLEDGL
jgi:hypothetical protein